MRKTIEISDGVIFVKGVTELELRQVLEKYQQTVNPGAQFITDIYIFAAPPTRFERALTAIKSFVKQTVQKR